MMLRRIEWASLDEAGRRAALARPPAPADADVAAIIAEVRAGGDAALRRLTERLDGVTLDALRVEESAIANAADALPAATRAAIDTAAANIAAFHEAGRTEPYEIETVPGVICRREVRPIRAVGLYVPGGTAPLPSTVLMLGVPSRLAGNPVRVLCTPPRADGTVDPAILYAAHACGISDVFRIGGAQAIAALSFGTESVPRVDKVFGPGNAWVTAAKQFVARDASGIAIDLPAGPSELMVVADASAVPEFVAADLLSQAEHGVDSQVMLVTDSAALIDAVDATLERRVNQLERGGFAARSLERSCAILVRGTDEAMEVANRYAPEHLSLALADAEARVADVAAAGSVFVGHWTPEALGDYCSGTNHVLPTGGYTRAYSGLAVSDFETRISVQRATSAGLRALGPTAIALARVEGLGAHAESVEVRLDACS